MNGRMRHKLLFRCIVVGSALLLTPLTAQADTASMPGAGLGTHWLPQLTDRVLSIHYSDRPDHGKMEPYLQQLMVVRGNLLRGNGAEVYQGMNRFMDMLEAKQNNISDKTADELFDYTFEVTPAKFVNQKRYLAKFKETTAPYMKEFLQDVGGTGGTGLLK